MLNGKWCLDVNDLGVVAESGELWLKAEQLSRQTLPRLVSMHIVILPVFLASHLLLVFKSFISEFNSREPSEVCVALRSRCDFT